MIDWFDSGLWYYVWIIVCDLDIDVLSFEGGGVVGGMGVVLYVFCGVQLCLGIEIVIDVLQLVEWVVDVDLVIIGEGCIDSQMIYGKVLVGVVRVVKCFNVLVIGIVGSFIVDVGVVYQYGLDVVFSVLYIICIFDEVLVNVVVNL